MAKPTLSDFLNDRNALATRISSAELAGFFRKSLRIPPRTAGLALFDDGTAGLFESGRDVTGTFDLVLAKLGDAALRFQFPDLRSADGHRVAATAEVSVEIAATRLDLFRDFCRAFFNHPGSFGAEDLETRLAPELRRSIGAFAAARPAADLHRADLAIPLGGEIAAGLERFLFDGGVRYHRLVELSIVSSDYERQASGERSRQEEQRRAVEVMDRKEERLRRIAGLLKDQEVQNLLAKVPDERQRGLLYAKLMEDDHLRITADELVSKARDCGEEVVQVIYKAMENLLSTGASVAPEEVEPSRAGRVFAAAGNRVLEIDPDGSGDPRLHAFPDALRSVRTAETSKGEFLLGGGKRSVSALALFGDAPAREYPLPARAVKGGVNSIAMDDRFLYATHSEYGLAAWPLEGYDDPPRFLFEDATRGRKTTRAVELHRGELLFSSGAHVYRGAPAGGSVVKYVSSVESPVTCVAAAARTIFAGTESGSILCWKLDAPDQPVVLVRKRDAIVTLRLAKICGIPHLLYGAKDLSVRARVIGQTLETSYETDGTAIGVLDAASDVICASAGVGGTVRVWWATAPSRPDREIDMRRQTDKPVLDVWMSKRRATPA